MEKLITRKFWINRNYLLGDSEVEVTDPQLIGLQLRKLFRHFVFDVNQMVELKSKRGKIYGKYFFIVYELSINRFEYLKKTRYKITQEIFIPQYIILTFEIKSYVCKYWLNIKQKTLLCDHFDNSLR